MNACVFAGPTLPPHDEARKQAATWLPPAQHGDVYRAVMLLQPRAIGIVDGYFASVPSVWHKEILWAIHEGVHVFGAGSMGALRAAELAAFGMRGVGVVFEAYRDGALEGAGEPFEDDDEVAVVHGPADSGYLAGSEAMVNIRCTLARAERAGVIGAPTRARLAGLAKALFFPERSYERLLHDAQAAGLPVSELAALQAWLPKGRVNQKRDDALAMLEAMRAFLEGNPGRAEAQFRFERTTLWERASAAMLVQPRPVERPGLPRATQFSELQLLELTDWYFSRVLGQDIPDDLEGWARGRGYGDLARFHQAIFNEYVDRHA